jgi:hypothetical protein
MHPCAGRPVAAAVPIVGIGESTFAFFWLRTVGPTRGHPRPVRRVDGGEGVGRAAAGAFPPQPTKLTRQAGSTLYTWAYSRLLFGQPIRLDVQGIAPIDRLGELTWLGPFSVLVFGLIVGLVVRAASVPKFDLWMLLLTVGTFAGAYPLMYFAQEYIALSSAVLISGGFALTVIGVLALTLMGVWLALGGVLLPATAILAVTLSAAIWPALQGVLLTVEVLGFFIIAMLLLARIRAAATAAPAAGQEIPSAPE